MRVLVCMLGVLMTCRLSGDMLVDRPEEELSRAEALVSLSGVLSASVSVVAVSLRSFSPSDASVSLRLLSESGGDGRERDRWESISY